MTWLRRITQQGMESRLTIALQPSIGGSATHAQRMHCPTTEICGRCAADGLTSLANFVLTCRPIPRSAIGSRFLPLCNWICSIPGAHKIEKTTQYIAPCKFVYTAIATSSTSFNRKPTDL